MPQEMEHTLGSTAKCPAQLVFFFFFSPLQLGQQILLLGWGKRAGWMVGGGSQALPEAS